MKLDGKEFKRVRADLDGIFVADEDGKIFKMTPVVPYLKAGYEWVRLPCLGKQKPFNLARLVLEAFHPEHDPNDTVDHIDCDKENNAVSNLQWLTRKENLAKAVDDGLMGIPIYKFDSEGNLVDSYKTVTEACDENGLKIDNFRQSTKRRCAVRRGDFFYSRFKKISKEDIQNACRPCFSNESVPIGQYSDGELVREYRSIKEACRVTGFSRELIRKSLRAGCVVRRFTFKFL